MIQSKKRSFLALLLVACFAATVAAFSASCSGSKGGGPTPVSTLTNCQLVFVSAGTNVGYYDVFVVDMPIADWTSGNKSYDVSVPGSEKEALFYNEFQKLNGQVTYVSRAITTNGSFDVTVASGTAQGSPVGWVDSSQHTFFDLNGANQVGNQVATGGNGHFTGVFSDPTIGANPTNAPGAVVQITYMGTQEFVGAGATPGGQASYALCYNAAVSSFAPLSPAARVERELDQTFQF